MKLYDLTPGMNPRRVRIFLAEKGIEIPKTEVDMMKGENKAPEFLAINPMGTLPVLELDDGTLIAESIAICRYFEEQQPEPPLFGRDQLERARVEMWNRRMELEIMIPVAMAFRHTNKFWAGRLEQVPAWGELARAHALDRLAWLDGVLADREFIATGDYTVADITLQCGLLLAKNTGTAIPEDLANLNRWFKAVTSRPTARA